MKVALVLCPMWDRELPHLAMALLSASLKKAGHEVFKFDLNNQWYHASTSEERTRWGREHEFCWVDKQHAAGFVTRNEALIDATVRQILASGARLIGFSVYYTTEYFSLEIARRIKRYDPSRVVVFGGPQCLREQQGRSLVRNEAVDAVVMGEGDATIVELTNSLERHGSLEFNDGILFRRDGEIVDCGERAPVIDLDNLPLPDFSGVSPEDYAHPEYMSILSSRGCVNRCVFCSVNSYWSHKYRSMSGQRIYREIESCIDTFPSVRVVNFFDPLLNGIPAELSVLCDLIIRNTEAGRIPPIRLRGNAIFHPGMTGELIRRMRKAGFCDLIFGMESGSQKVVNRMRKNFKVEDAERIIREVHAAGIKVTLNFMFGFPTETAADFNETLEFIKRNHARIDMILPSESFCSIHQNVYLYDHAEEFGVWAYPHADFWETKDGTNNYPERMRRFEVFCSLCLSLGVQIAQPSIDKIRLYKDHYLSEYMKFKNRALLPERVPKMGNGKHLPS